MKKYLGHLEEILTGTIIYKAIMWYNGNPEKDDRKRAFMVNRLRKLIKPDIKTNLVALLIFACIILYYSIPLGIIALGIVLYLFYYSKKVETGKKQLLKEYIENITEEMDETIKYSFINHPLPLCMIDGEGEIFWYNKKFNAICGKAEILNTKLTDLVNIKLTDLITEDQEKNIQISMNGKVYRIAASKTYSEDGGNIILYWFDITTYENLKTIYKDEKNCFGYVHVDNYDDLIDSSPADKKSMVAAQIETAIRQWATKISAALSKYDDDKYLIIFENKHYDKLEENKFAILDEVREIETDADFPVSLSIGIDIGGKTPQQQVEYASAALDLALGRGGDQAVVKKINKIDYFGGKLQAVEKRNKGKSKIMAHALKQLIDQSARVIIMGHKKPDMDSFGAALGIYRIAKNKNKEAYIVINAYNEALQTIYKRASESGNYNFINNSGALSLIDKDTLLVVVDTHRPSFTECPELLSKTERIVVIDHHRKTEENIENATLNYMEAYASSTSELIAEIMQYIGDKKEIDKFEAEALLAGITVDTKSFSVKTGVRTFEAASWLRRSGADLASVKQFFQNDMEMYKIKSEAIINAKIIKGGVAISKCEGVRANMHLMTSQAADELLNIKGVKAAFVVGRNNENHTAVSARSLGEINVQIIMEKMGGGGHLTMAGGQIDLSVEDTMIEIERLVNEIVNIKSDGNKK